MVLGAITGVAIMIVIAIKVCIIVRYCRKKKKSKETAPKAPVLVSEYQEKVGFKEKTAS